MEVAVAQLVAGARPPPRSRAAITKINFRAEKEIREQ